MFLIRKKYVGRAEIEIISNKYDFLSKDTVGKKYDNIMEVCILDCQWRKANAIHNWFVENVQDGEDDCREYYVGLDQLKELVEICKKVDKDHDLAEELLPTVDGFFFGSKEYDEYYFEDIKYTIEKLEDAIKKYDATNDSFYYSASW